MAYEWAVNQTKLAHAKAWAAQQKKLDPTFDVSEAAIKDRYVSNAGLIREKPIVNAEEEAPAPKKTPKKAPATE